MKKILLLVACVCLTAVAQAQIPSTLGWYEVPNTKLSTVCPPTTYPACLNVTVAWGGGTFDTTRNRIIVWGGGHQDYSGNEVYAVNLSGTPSVSLLTQPTAAGCSLASCDGGSTPNARHTYDTLTYAANIDSMWNYGGSPSGNGYATNDAWLLHFPANNWQSLNPVSTGLLPAAVLQDISEYDPVTGNIYLTDGRSEFTYNTTNHAWTTVRFSDNGFLGNNFSGVWDPMRRKMYVLTNGSQLWALTFDGVGPGLRTVTGATSILGDAYAGMAYDPVSTHIIMWSGGSTVYEFNPDSNIITSITGYTGGPGPASVNGTYGRWNYSPALGVFTLLNSMDQNAFTFRLNNGTPPVPDTMAPSAPTNLTASAISSSQILLNWTAATDNIGVAGYRVERCQGSDCTTFVQTATPTITSYADSGLSASTTYVYRARAADAAGNLSAYSMSASAATPVAPPPGGPIISYSFDVMTGASIADLSGNGHTATAVNGPTLVAGKYGNAVNLDGLNDYLLASPVVGLPAANSPRTESLWFKTPNNIATTRVMAIEQNLTGTAVQLELRNNLIDVAVWGGNTMVTSPAASFAVWHYLAYTFDGTSHRLYVDGVLQATTTTAPQTGTPDRLYFGTYSGLGQFFGGQIDDFRLYNRALTASEIVTDMNTPLGGPPPPATTRTVGPGKMYSTICAAVAAAQSGDTIEIDAGTYLNESCFVPQNNLTIKSIAGNAHMKWGTGDSFTNTATIPNGKGILVIGGDNVTLEGLEFSGAKVADENGAGIRYEGGNLTVRGSYFHGNENGILGQGGATSTLLVENCIFDQNGFCGAGGCGHNAYIGNMGRLIFRGNKSVDSRDGSHTLKSRALVSEVYANYLSTKNSDGSYEADFPNGGTVYFIGNIIEQGANTSNATMLSWGAEGATNPNPKLFAINNTFNNLRTNGATFVQVNGTPIVSLKNNAWIGGGTPLVGASADLTSNKALPIGDFVNASAGDFHLVAGSTAINAGVAPGVDGIYSLTPAFEYVETANKTARMVVGALDIGAYEFGTVTSSVDTTPPTITWITPNNSSFTTNDISLRVAASDNVGVTCVELYRAGQTKAIVVNCGTKLPNPLYLRWQDNPIPIGTYTLTAFAYDAAGKQSLPAPLTVIRK